MSREAHVQFCERLGVWGDSPGHLEFPAHLWLDTAEVAIRGVAEVKAVPQIRTDRRILRGSGWGAEEVMVQRAF